MEALSFAMYSRYVILKNGRSARTLYCRLAGDGSIAAQAERVLAALEEMLNPK